MVIDTSCHCGDVRPLSCNKMRFDYRMKIMRYTTFFIASIATVCSVGHSYAQSDGLIFKNDKYAWYTDRIEQGEFTGKALSPVHLSSNFEEERTRDFKGEWKPKYDLAFYPQLQTPFLLEHTLYNMSLDEMVNAIEPDSTLRTGSGFPGVWTRDVSYSIILSMAYMQPKVSMNCLLRKVDRFGRIIQDTGTGGSWPCSTDRMIWAVAAWEIYKVTGSREWLEKVYPIIRKSVEDDYLTVYDEKTGLVMGESSFIDWRNQSYPRWMQPVDIFQSKCLGTNAVHVEALRVLSCMAGRMGDTVAEKKYATKSKQVADAVNRYLWMPEKGYYAQFLYGRNYNILSSRSESLGESLAILWGIAPAGKRAEIIRNAPVCEFGTPIFYPEIPNIPPYHNNAVWPFVSSYWMHAAAMAGNEEAVLHAVGSIYRAAALFVTNKENFVLSTGNYRGTQINSSNMLWSLSGNLSIVYKLLMGIHFDDEQLLFKPFVPKALTGRRILKNFPYRSSTLDIEVEGHGNKIKAFYLDGKKQNPIVAGTLTGHHDVKIVMANNELKKQGVNLQPAIASIETPVIKLEDSNKIVWNKIESAVAYRILRNGKKCQLVETTHYRLPEDAYGEYQVIAVAANKYTASFASEPIVIEEHSTYEVEDYAPKSERKHKGFMGTGFVNIDKKENTMIEIPVSIKDEGLYAIDWRYANGNNTIADDNRCAIRSLYVDNHLSGVSIFPQRGMNAWENWGWSNSHQVHLTPGEHTISLSFEPHNENMNINVNQALIDQLRLTRLKK